MGKKNYQIIQRNDFNIFKTETSRKGMTVKKTLMNLSKVTHLRFHHKQIFADNYLKSAKRDF